MWALLLILGALPENFLGIFIPHPLPLDITVYPAHDVIEAVTVMMTASPNSFFSVRIIDLFLFLVSDCLNTLVSK